MAHPARLERKIPSVRLLFPCTGHGILKNIAIVRLLKAQLRGELLDAFKPAYFSDL
jgi:hypothetical protein